MLTKLLIMTTSHKFPSLHVAEDVGVLLDEEGVLLGHGVDHEAALLAQPGHRVQAKIEKKTGFSLTSKFSISLTFEQVCCFH